MIILMCEHAKEIVPKRPCAKRRQTIHLSGPEATIIALIESQLMMSVKIRRETRVVITVVTLRL